MGTGRILIVDDEPTVLAVIEGVLEDPWTVATAPSGPAALELLQREQFDLLIVDKNMPEMDGVQLVRAIRDAGNAVPIVMLTGYASPTSAAETLNLGIDAYLEKPLKDIFDVREIVSKVLARRRPRWTPVPATPSTRPGAALTVLVAARHEGVCDRLWALLEPARDEVVLAAEPAEIVAAIQRDAPDILVIEAASYWDEFTELVTNLRHVAPETACVVLSERLALAEIKMLIDLGVNALIDQAGLPERFGDLVRLARWVKLGAQRPRPTPAGLRSEK
jgi:CheY-like chemotaxis protein